MPDRLDEIKAELAMYGANTMLLPSQANWLIGEVERLREIAAGEDDGGHWYSQQTMDAVSGERDGLRQQLAEANEEAETECMAAEGALRQFERASAECDTLRQQLADDRHGHAGVVIMLRNDVSVANGEIASLRELAAETARSTGEWAERAMVAEAELARVRATVAGLMDAANG